MSHVNLSASVFASAILLVVGGVRAQQPSSAEAPAEARSEPAQTPPSASAKPAPAQTAQATSISEPAGKSATQKGGSNSAPVSGIVVTAGPSADILRAARDAGFNIKIADGKTHFCKTQAPLGSRFVSESCMSEQQVTLWLSRAQDQREKVQNLLGAPANSR
jgi:pyruvate/2-oxoglutarate dehydrogenase complex dihydrolipoamide acyltransferase (E2) component